ncbi:hypothetical protein B7P43_G06739 [Cryptotermes secundus]|uniref:Uncharacterized protein n=2 Tax=Cryptotermes secundus TaxID=105785 RepID=A0A2J7QZ83_9NEOP|nr:hypothetical protein B7P43_G06739 [Cryptotermes secundus]
MSLYYQAVFNLPTEASQWSQAPDILGKREISNTPLLDMYLPLEEFLEEYGFDGRACLLRSICEAAHAPFQHENMDLLEEMAHAVLTPSEGVQLGEAHCSDSSYGLEYLPLERQYVAAECLGKSDGNCGTAYSNCPKSPLDMISQTLNLQLLTE